MNIKKTIAALTFMTMLPACAGGFATGSYSPVVDAYGSPGKDPNLYAGELNLCQQLAASRPQVNDGLKGAGVGAAVGAGGGAVAGAIDGGNALSGAGYGAALGALVGGGVSLYQANQNRQNVVIDCMRQRGWSVIGR